MKVQVDRPLIENDRVSFRWTQSAPNPFQIANEFWFRYEGIDLTRFSSALFYEIFLALQMKVFAAYDEPVEIEFADPVSEWSFAYWQAFHNAFHVSVSPLSGDRNSPWRAPHLHQTIPESVAVFYGGGKDSLSTACLFHELYGPSNVVLIQCIAPIRPKRELAERLDLRQEGLMLRPARERLGVKTQRVWTDYLSLFVRSADDQRPEIELYAFAGLPALLHHRVPLATFSYDWTGYPVVRHDDGSTTFVNPDSRPEVFRAHRLHLQEALGIELAITNVTLLCSPWTAYRLVVERYPRAADLITSCTIAPIDQRWCYECRKCLAHALLAIRSGQIDDRFDYDRLFSDARLIERLIEFAASGIELGMDNNAPYSPFLCAEKSFQSICHVLAGIDSGPVKSRLSEHGYANLITLMALYGNRLFPHIEQMPVCVVPRLEFSDAGKIVALVAQHFEVVDVITARLSIGDQLVEFGLNQRMPTRMDSLTHIRASNG